MHSVIFRTQLLKDCGLHLPEHTFYVDNIYVFEPLLHVNTMYYLDVNFYRYYIGRADQSVNETVMISRLDQQIRVNKIMIDFYTEHKNQIIRCKRRHQYMRNYLEIIMTVSSALCLVLLVLSPMTGFTLPANYAELQLTDHTEEIKAAHSFRCDDAGHRRG